MPISKTKRQLSTNGLRHSKPYARPSFIEPSHTAPDASYFPLKPTQYPPGTPITAVRSKKLYSDLVDERAFLLNLKEFWTDKLAELKEDHKYLCKMRDVHQNQVVGVQPLFAREEDEPHELQHPPLPNATSAEEGEGADASVADTQAQLSSPGQLSLLGDSSELNNLSQLDQLEALFKNKFSDDEDNGDEVENEEDEAKTREALSLLLQEFGDM